MEGWQEEVDRGWRVLSTGLVFFMQAGFMLMQMGSVREKNTHAVVVASFLDAGIAAIFWLIFGHPLAAMSWPPSLRYLADEGTVDWSEVAFGLALCMTCVTIVSGSALERANLSAYFPFAAVTAGFTHSVVVRWAWSRYGWLSSTEWAGEDWPVFHDAGGGTVVHMVGGIAGIIFAIGVGPRIGRFSDKDGKAVHYHMATPSVHLFGAGVLVLWFGWIGLNAGSTKSLSGGGAASAARAMMLTLLSPAGGLLTVAALTWLRSRCIAEPCRLCTGGLAGLAAISAPCAVLDVWAGIFVGCVGSLLSEFIQALLVRFGVDDPLGAFAVHAACGAWGTLAVGILGAGWSAHPASGKQFAIQLLGILVIAAWTVAFSLVTLFLIGRITSLRASLELELRGLDHELFVGAGSRVAAENTSAPEGQVVIVMTDVQGSTQLWVEDASSMAGATAVHDHVMRSQIAAYNGYEITTEGDAFQVAFSNATDALGFCLAAQRELLHADWQPEILRQADAAPLEFGNELLYRGLRIRMGVDMGWCKRSLHETSRTFRYEGAAFDVAKRITDCQSSGGIIIISNRVQEEISPRISRLGGLVSVCDLGTFLLSATDTEPIGLFAVMHPDIALRVPLMDDLEVHSLVRNGYMQAPSVRSMHYALVKSIPTGMRTSSFAYEVQAQAPLWGRFSRFMPRNKTRGLPKSSMRMKLEPLEEVLICFATLLRPWGSQEVSSMSPRTIANSDADSVDPEDDTQGSSWVNEFSTDGQEDAAMVEASLLIRSTLEKSGGYECQEDKGVFMLAFDDCHKACEWGCQISDLIVDRFSKHFRFAMGMHVGVPTEVRPHTTTGRADYFGTVVNAAARVHSLARKDAAGRGACLYVTPQVQEAASNCLTGDREVGREGLRFAQVGKYSLKGFRERVDIYRVEVKSVVERQAVPSGAVVDMVRSVGSSSSRGPPGRTTLRRWTTQARTLWSQDDMCVTDVDLSQLIHSVRSDT